MMHTTRWLEKLLGHEKITESARKKMVKKKDFYDQRLAMITLILQKKTKEK